MDAHKLRRPGLTSLEMKAVARAVALVVLPTSRAMFLTHAAALGDTPAEAELHWQALRAMLPRIGAWQSPELAPSMAPRPRAAEPRTEPRRAPPGRPLVVRPAWFEETRWQKYRRLVEAGLTLEAHDWKKRCEDEWHAALDKGDTVLPLGLTPFDPEQAEHEWLAQQVPTDLRESWTWDMAIENGFKKGKLTVAEALESGMPAHVILEAGSKASFLSADDMGLLSQTLARDRAASEGGGFAAEKSVDKPADSIAARFRG